MRYRSVNKTHPISRTCYGVFFLYIFGISQSFYLCIIHSFASTVRHARFFVRVCEYFRLLRGSASLHEMTDALLFCYVNVQRNRFFANAALINNIDSKMVQWMILQSVRIVRLHIRCGR